MTPEQLKESILQLAIQGKLIEQRSEEGTADELLADIRSEKEQLIKDGKIPKEKNLPEVSDEEKEFEIPDNWRYVRVQDIASYITDYVANGSFATLKKNTKTYKTPNYAIFVRTMDLTANFVGECSYIDKESYDFLEKSKLFGGELILPNIGGSIGKAFLMPDLGMPMSLAPNSIMLKFKHVIMNKFFSYIIQSPYGKNFLIDTKGGTATPKFSKTELRNMVVMLPPIKEIERIVTRIDELLPYVDRYAEAHEKLEKFNAKFPEDMKKSILQYAVQGKLVEQRAEEGTADGLFKHIQDEKTKLIKEGKIKKEKPLDDILDDEIPFEIPDSWKWERLGNILVIERGGSPRPIKEFITTDDDGINWIKIGDTEKGSKYINSCAEKIKPEGMKKSRYVEKGDFILSNSMSFGRPYILNIDGCIHDGWLVLRQPVQVFDNDYLYYLLSSPMVFYQFCGRVAGAVVNNLNSDKVALTVVPIPPMEEQKRIVAKIEELIPYCDRLIR